MNKLIAILFLALCPLFAHAATYYFSDCQTGADAACVAGSNSNAGTSSTSPKQTYTGMTLTPGDVYLLANGGSWSQGATFFVSCNTCVVGNSLTWSSYTPTWCVSTCASVPTKPLVTVTASVNGWEFSAGTTSGALLQNIKLVGPNSGTNDGVYMIQPDMLTLNNMDISAFYIGVFSLSFSTNISIIKSKIHDNLTQGFLGTAQGLLIENSTFDNNGFGGSPLYGDHNIYLTSNGSSQPPGNNNIVRGNTLTRSAVCNASSTDSTNCPTPDSKCKGTSIVSHRQQYGMVIENNTIDETTGASGGCYGIQIAAADNETTEQFTGSIVRGNKIVNVGDRAVHISNCPYCTVENNLISMLAASTGSIIAIDANNNGFNATTLNTHLVIRNNSIYIGAGSNASWVGIAVVTDGTAHRVYNNVVYLASGTSASMSCYSTLALTSFTMWDYNLCYRVGGANTYSNLYSTLALAQAAGADTHGSVSDPTLTATPASGNAYDIAFTSGLTKNGGTTPCPITTFGGLSRAGLGACDIGAHQQGASVLVPNSPTWAH